MHWYEFLWLIREIYSKPKPDLEKIQRLGLLAMKIGQVHALRADFLSPETCKHLAQLYRQTTSLPPEDAERLLATSTPSGWRDHFQSIDLKPVASASVGQVHRGVLKSGETVAIKLVKQTYADQFRRDVTAASRVFKTAIAFYPKLRGVANPVSLLREIEKTTVAELDLRNEITSHRTFADLVVQHQSSFDLSDIRLLKTYPELSNERVLVSEFIEAPTLDELMQRGELSYEQLLRFFHLQGFFMFSVGTFHGDIHPGNIFYDQGKFVFVDAGYLGTVSDRLRRGLFEFFVALSSWDYTTCATKLNAMATPGISGPAFERFEKKLVELYADFKNTTVSQVSLTRRMMQTIRLGVLSGMSFEEGIFDIIKSLMYLDGMVLRVNPQAVIMRDMRAFIDEYRKLV